MNRCRLLVVDGEEQIRKLLRAALVRAGYVVHAAGSAEEAIRTWGLPLDFDVVICETLLPGMDGHAFSHQLAVSSPRTRVLFVCNSDTHCATCPRAPHCPAIGKPFDPAQVIQTVAELIAVRG